MLENVARVSMSNRRDIACGREVRRTSGYRPEAYVSLRATMWIAPSAGAFRHASHERISLRQTRQSWRNLRRTMSVLLETSLGDITIDLLVDDAPKCCEK
jgi:hypothetical protein